MSKKKDTKKILCSSFDFDFKYQGNFKNQRNFSKSSNQKKIKNIQKFINNDSKLKLKLNMTTKRLSRKQVIVLIAHENKSKFMKTSNAHITNLNSVIKQRCYKTRV